MFLAYQYAARDIIIMYNKNDTMKNEKNIAESEGKEQVSGTDPKNMFKKSSMGATPVSVDHFIASEVNSVKAGTDHDLSDEGAAGDYQEEI